MAIKRFIVKLYQAIADFILYRSYKKYGGNHKEMALKLKALRETVNFYKWELKKEDLTEKERDKYLKALKLIEKIIGGKREVWGK